MRFSPSDRPVRLQVSIALFSPFLIKSDGNMGEWQFYDPALCRVHKPRAFRQQHFRGGGGVHLGSDHLVLRFWYWSPGRGRSAVANSSCKPCTVDYSLSSFDSVSPLFYSLVLGYAPGIRQREVVAS